MTIAKHSKDLSLQQSRKRQYLLEIHKMVPVILLASLVGTYLDLYFVGKELYSFPIRFMPDIFSINILFTLIGLPIMIIIYLLIVNRLRGWWKGGFILLLSIFMSAGEKLAEQAGFFHHQDSWKHWYSTVGYAIYLFVIYSYFLFQQRK